MRSSTQRIPVAAARELTRCLSLSPLSAFLCCSPRFPRQGTFCTVGVPEVPIQLHAFSVILAQATFTGSAIGSISEIRSMLAFVDKHRDIRPLIERLPMHQVNDGIQRVRDGKVRFRVVLENPTAESKA